MVYQRQDKTIRWCSMTFIIHFKDGHRETYNNRYDEDVEHERDAAWDDVYAAFPDADYIESF